MRIPASVVVMSCVTALPFGLAIRDTARGTQRGDELDLTGEKTREREMRERAEREEAKARAEYEARMRERDAELDSIYGKAPGTRGTLTEPTAGIDVIDDGESVTVTVSPNRCGRLHERVLAAWGANDSNIWIDAVTHQRAGLSEDGCSLTFDTSIEPEDWVAQLPFAAVGTPVGRSEWHMPGTGYGHLFTHVYVESDRERVTSLNVIGYTDLETQRRIREAITTRLKTQPEVLGTNTWTWRTTPPITLDASGASRFSVQIGHPAWQ